MKAGEEMAEHFGVVVPAHVFPRGARETAELRHRVAVSVCMPNYNHGRYLPEAIESVLRQNYEDFELLIIDNCSTDDSVEIIKRYADRDTRICRRVLDLQARRMFSLDILPLILTESPLRRFPVIHCPIKFDLDHLGHVSLGVSLFDSEVQLLLFGLFASTCLDDRSRNITHRPSAIGPAVGLPGEPAPPLYLVLILKQPVQEKTVHKPEAGPKDGNDHNVVRQRVPDGLFPEASERDLSGDGDRASLRRQ
jgi:cellulose synthase/poly-beta-1,6-N-acetylglucosamine synthase-like glycosyltransferase